MDYLREMALFVEVARMLSFKRAAASLGVPTSTLSRRIADLERAVGVRLLNRTTRSIELTEAGALYFERCRDIVEAARVAHEKLGEVAERPSGRLRVSTTAEFARLYFGPLVSDYARLYPQVTLEIDLNPNRVDLITQNYDIAIRIGPQPDSGIISRHLGTLRTTLFASPGFLSAAGIPTRPEDLASYSVVRNLNAPQPNVWALLREGETVEVPVVGPIVVNNFGFMRQMALAGMGIVMLHEPMVAPDVRAGRLKRVLPDWVVREAPVYALTASRLLPAKTRLFLAMLSSRVAPHLAASSGTGAK
ncbi:LysR substrate-binding domain-containing protein [Sphingomonas sp. ASV193]|uniref:LysR family transcriptional regulator n=1 Tax=Sphingomonas sp. ASV193 TaxID=3144405 RepID=UPI0032E91C07